MRFADTRFATGFRSGPHALQPGRHAWVQVVRGSIKLNGSALIAGDGAAIVDEPLDLTASSASEALLIDLA